MAMTTKIRNKTGGRALKSPDVAGISAATEQVKLLVSVASVVLTIAASVIFNSQAGKYSPNIKYVIALAFVFFLTAIVTATVAIGYATKEIASGSNDPYESRFKRWSAIASGAFIFGLVSFTVACLFELFVTQPLKH